VKVKSAFFGERKFGKIPGSIDFSGFERCDKKLLRLMENTKFRMLRNRRE